MNVREYRTPDGRVTVFIEGMNLATDDLPLPVFRFKRTPILVRPHCGVAMRKRRRRVTRWRVDIV